MLNVLPTVDVDVVVTNHTRLSLWNTHLIDVSDNSEPRICGL